MNTTRYFLLVPAVALLLTGCFSNRHISRSESFRNPDIKDEFCGAQINFQYCKCAFHNDYCDQIGMSKGEANDYVNAEYDKWRQGLVDVFSANCLAAGGFFEDDKCSYCAEGYEPVENACVNSAEVVREFKPDGPLTADCQVDRTAFESDWKKYSDIDDAIPFEDRSFEAKQALTVYEDMVSKMVRAFELERDIEIEQQLQAELIEYRTALVNNIKTNLLKAFWRLSWVTYSTIKTGTSLGESFEQLLTSAEGIEAIGTGLKVVQGVIPSDSSLAINTDTLAGKAKSVGAAAALEAVESLGDPVKVATSLFENASNAALPSADITEEEASLLKDQHLKKGVIDKALTDSRNQVTAWQAELATLEQEIGALQTQVNEWEGKEKERVQTLLEDSCRTQKSQFETQNN